MQFVMMIVHRRGQNEKNHHEERLTAGEHCGWLTEGNSAVTTSAPTTAPIADGLFTWPSAEPRLIGGACLECGSVSFPRQPSCSRCTAESIAEHLLPRVGSLWSWTVQRFRPKEPYDGPEPFEPYGVGYVELAGEVIVESRLTTADPDHLEIGRPMELVVVPFVTRDDGSEVVTFAFRPARGTVPA
jgi:uncharacterized OB-fold protein